MNKILLCIGGACAAAGSLLTGFVLGDNEKSRESKISNSLVGIGGILIGIGIGADQIAEKNKEEV